MGEPLREFIALVKGGGGLVGGGQGLRRARMGEGAGEGRRSSKNHCLNAEGGGGRGGSVRANATWGRPAKERL